MGAWLSISQRKWIMQWCSHSLHHILVKKSDHWTGNSVQESSLCTPLLYFLQRLSCDDVTSLVIAIIMYTHKRNNSSGLFFISHFWWCKESSAMREYTTEKSPRCDHLLDKFCQFWDFRCSSLNHLVKRRQNEFFEKCYKYFQMNRLNSRQTKWKTDITTLTMSSSLSSSTLPSHIYLKWNVPHVWAVWSFIMALIWVGQSSMQRISFTWGGERNWRLTWMWCQE